jgi:tetratricopeptide (TPR) repeat protein
MNHHPLRRRVCTQTTFMRSTIQRALLSLSAATLLIGSAGQGCFAAGKPTYAHKMEIGQLLFFNGDIDRAINAFLAAGELNPKAFEPHLNLINLYIQKGTPESLSLASEQCREVIKRKPGNRDVHLILSNLLRTEASSETDLEVQKKKLSEAEKEAEEAERLGASEPLCENQIGVIKLQLGDSAGAMEHIDQAIRKQAVFPDAHLIKAVLLFKTINSSKEAQDPATAAKALNAPENKKTLDEVLKELDTAVTQKGGANAEASNTKADILFALNRIPEAATAYGKAGEADPRYAQAWAGLGNCEAQMAGSETDESKKQEHIKAARDAYDKAKKLRPNDKNIIYGLAVMLEKMGQTNDAMQEFNNGLMLETDPLMRAQIQMHVQQMGGSAMRVPGLGSFDGGGAGGVGNNIFTSGALSTPFKDLIKIKAPPGHEGEKKSE